jgi:hypothetical protein
MNILRGKTAAVTGAASGSVAPWRLPSPMKG